MDDESRYGSTEVLVPQQEQPRRQQRQQQQQQQQQQGSRGPTEPLLDQAPNPKYTPEQEEHRARVEARRRQRAMELEEQEKELELKYGAESVLSLIKPVSLCMLVVVATVRSVSYYATNDTQFVYTPYESNANASNSEKFGGAVLNALIIIGIVVLMTFFLLLLYKYRCYKAIHGWLLLSSLLLLFFFSYQYLNEVLLAYNKGIDWITMGVTVWNFGVAGLVAIHWRGPLIVQQVYLVLVSALMALVLLKNLPDWTTWVVLAAVAIYDLFAVLSPCGPLKALVETAQEREEPLFPALIYSSGMAWIVNMADDEQRTRTSRREEDGSDNARTASQSTMGASNRTRTTSHVSSSHDSQGIPMEPLTRRTQTEGQAEQQRQQSRQPEAEEEESGSGVKLGLGDFIFYSVLVGKAATANEWTTISACYVAILIGLACTLMLLSIFRKALPALPISIFFGIVFYFLTSQILDPLVNELNNRQIFL